MWKCPVCGQKNEDDSVVCAGCQYDGSTDFARHMTVVPLSDPVKMAADSVDSVKAAADSAAAAKKEEKQRVSEKSASTGANEAGANATEENTIATTGDFLDDGLGIGGYIVVLILMCVLALGCWGASRLIL